MTFLRRGPAALATLLALLSAAACGTDGERPDARDADGPGTRAPGGRADGTPALELLFRVDSLDGPESVAWDGSRKRWLVSNAGAGEGRGYLTAVGSPGWSVVRAAYGADTPGLRLDSPKGMAVVGDRLYLADLRRVVALDLAGDTGLFALEIAEAGMLNDVAVGPDGRLLVSDTRGDRVYRVEPDGSGYAPLGAAGSLRAPNGLLVERGDADRRLLVAGWDGALLTLAADSSLRLLAESPTFRNLDGLQPAPGGGLLVTDFTAGRLIHLRPRPDHVWQTGTVWLSGLEGPADFLVRDGLLVLPELRAGRVSFYRMPEAPDAAPR